MAKNHIIEKCRECRTCLYVVSRSNASKCGLVTVNEFAAAKHNH